MGVPEPPGSRRGRKKIAVVGTGIAGDVASYLLSRDHDLTVFEQDDHVGGHTSTVRVDAEDGSHQVDTGFIVFNEEGYPSFVKLLRRLGLRSTSGPNLAWFRRADHFGDPGVPLDVSIRNLVAERTGVRPEGPIRLLTHLRYLGHCFHPVSFYYCFADDGRTLETVVAEVSNTPWKERHMYVLPESQNRATAESKRYDFAKAFHVSPFLEMDMAYAWRFGSPPEPDGEPLWVHMENRQGEARVFEATLTLERRALTGRELARALALRPAMTAQVVLAIHWQALRRAHLHPHPGTLPTRNP